MSSPENGRVLDNLWTTEDESFEVQMPDFHFDWGLEKGKTAEQGIKAPTASLRSLSIKEITPPLPSGSSSTSTPSHSTLSARSSISSAQILPKRGASNASSSPHIPTPPGSVANPGHRSVSVQNIANPGGSSGGESSGERGKVYGGRKFQRVTSAPISPEDERETERVEFQVSGNGCSKSESATNPHTTTIRPPHTQLPSAPLDDTSTVPNHSNFITPALPERTLPIARSTVRRLGGLSKFGGPARRVILPQGSEDVQVQESVESSNVNELQGRHNSAPINRPPQGPPDVYCSYDQASTSPTATAGCDNRLMNISHPDDRTVKSARKPVNQSVHEINESIHEPLASATQPQGEHGVSRISAALSSEGEDRLFRPFGKLEEKLRPVAGPSKASGLRYMDSLPETGPEARDMQGNSPRSSDVGKSASPPYRNLRAARPPPVTESRRNAPMVSTATAVSAPASHPMMSSEILQPPPTQSVPQGKTLFHVNGVPYERLQRLGKGGSSTVYSVLYSGPKKRIIYALKVVQLDRADSETYQSYTNEIELLKRLRGHDRVIQLIDHQITFNQHNRPHRLLMVMECGEIDFAALLDEQRGKAINMNFVGLYWEQMLEAVQAVHRENVVHTDLKPANFVLVKGRLKIIDFGIAKAIANDTVNIQRDQQIGTVNYMSPEAIQRMNNQKVLKLSYPSDVWSLGCILYQMIYGSPPFQHVSGGPLAKMGVIADPNHVVTYPEVAVPKAAVGFSLDGHPTDPASLSVPVSPSAIDSMKRCLAYRKEHRLTIPELLQHEFLKPRIRAPAVPPGSTPITQYQMERLVNFILSENGLPELSDGNHTAEDLFSQLEAQNALSR
ncbi:serine/threonine-protein kinase TTK/MPS1 [Cryptococcus neoformans]|nr:serine/threonine-protein kinase TTK/MPS1 [Cryptococcus neoformans var. grubii]